MLCQCIIYKLIERILSSSLPQLSTSAKLLPSSSINLQHTVRTAVIYLTAAGALCVTPAAQGVNHRSLHTFPVSQQIKHKMTYVCYPPTTRHTQPYPLSDASPACSANKVRPLHDKVQSRIIKLEKDRETERNWHRHQTEKGPCEGEDSAEWKWCQLLNRRSEENSPHFLAHTHINLLPSPPSPPPPPPLWCICHDEKTRRHSDAFF